jgi:hypothetical protein
MSFRNTLLELDVGKSNPARFIRVKTGKVNRKSVFRKTLRRDKVENK